LISSVCAQETHQKEFFEQGTVSDQYRNRRKRFGLRFNLIAGICNYERLL